MRKIFSVEINNKPYHVYDLPNRRHAGHNNIPSSWWLYYSEELPGGLLPPEDSEYFQPFEKAINRRVWEINVKQRNYSKIKWGDVDFRNTAWIQMKCNGKDVYEFATSGDDAGLAYAFAQIQVLMVQLSEHPFNFFDTDSEHGRKICWYGLPATVASRGRMASIGIVPDYTTGYTKAQWWEELKRRQSKTTKLDEGDEQFEEMDRESAAEAKYDDFINWGSPLSDGNIYWFRK